MSSTFFGLEVSKRSLFTQQAALNTTGHNIANANTAGYSRQVVNMTASKPMEVPGLMRSTVPGQMGTGVEFSSITRIREKFLDDQFRNENKSLGSATVQSDALEKLETIINEPSDSGLRTVLDNFWKSWSDLAQDPENVTGRKIVRENAMALADTLNYTSKQLSDLSRDLTDNISVKAAEMNTYIKGIANLNQEITRIEGLGNDANDLRDQRDLLVDKLSKVVNVTVTNGSAGYDVSMGSVSLVSGISGTALTADDLRTYYDNGKGPLNSGEVHGLFVARDKYVSDYQTQMNDLANTIANGKVRVTLPAGSILPDGAEINKVDPATGTVTPTTIGPANRQITAATTIEVDGLNGLHKLGYLTTSPLKTGGDFFTAKDGSATITAANFQLSTDIANNPNLIATSMRTATSGGTESAVLGNNTAALLISQLKDNKFTFNAANATTNMTTGSVDEYLRSIVGQLGVQSAEAKRMTDNQQALVDQIDSRRQSVSGVSLDEEMANMLKFQHAYSAAARVMTTYDQMLDKIINSMGVVGR